MKSKKPAGGVSAGLLECDLQCRLYDEEGCVDLKEADCADVLADPRTRGQAPCSGEL